MALPPPFLPSFRLSMFAVHPLLARSIIPSATDELGLKDKVGSSLAALLVRVSICGQKGD